MNIVDFIKTDRFAKFIYKEYQKDKNCLIVKGILREYLYINKSKISKLNFRRAFIKKLISALINVNDKREELSVKNIAKELNMLTHICESRINNCNISIKLLIKKHIKIINYKKDCALERKNLLIRASLDLKYKGVSITAINISKHLDMSRQFVYDSLKIANTSLSELRNISKNTKEQEK